MSHAGNLDMHSVAIDAAVVTLVTLIVLSDGRIFTGPKTRSTSAPYFAAASARAIPIFPDD
jgi:hypothetical protein